MKPDVGRVFFHYDSDDKRVPSRVLLQTLESHVGNVERLARLWQCEAEDTALVLSQATEEKVIRAARLHDMGKPERFQIQTKHRRSGSGEEAFDGYEYSFSGHRFLAESADLYVQELAQGHHTYTTVDINDAIARLRRAGYDADHFAVDLYILEMCDQIEAEIAVRTLENKGEGRTFMEFTISGENGDYAVDPFPFVGQPIELTLEYYEFRLSPTQRAELLKCDERQPEPLGRLMNRFIRDAFQGSVKLPMGQQKVRIAPLLSRVTDSATALTCDEIYQVVCGFEHGPYEMQREVFSQIESGADALLIKAPTGQGKTEAVLLPSLALNKRLILPLPTRSLLEDHERRIEKYLLRFSELPENRNRVVSLIVDTGEESRRIIFVYDENENKVKKVDCGRRHLYKADVILTTLDKFLYRYFGFGDINKSFVYPLRIGDGSRTLICFDEAHTYDGVSFINFRRLVRALYECGQGVIVMTATMPEAYQAEIRFFEPVGPTGEIRPSPKTLRVVESPHDDLSDALVDEVLRARNDGARKVIVATEGVGFIGNEEEPTRRAWRDGAYNVYVKLKEQILAGKLAGLKPRENLFLYHGRLDKEERSALYNALKNLDEKTGASYLLVTTSAIEVGCDLDAQVLVTELCNPEQLIQRAGRCNRKGNYEDAKVTVVIPKQAYNDGGLIKPYTRSLTPEEEAAYVAFLKRSNGQPFDAAQFIKQVAKRPAMDYRVETLFDMLREYVYQARLENKPLYDRGFVVTRSWEPTLTFEIPCDGKTRRVSAPFSMCVCHKDERPEPGALVQEKHYHHDSNSEYKRSLRGGPVYGKQVIVELSKGFPTSDFAFDPEYGLVNVPKVFTWRRVSDYKVIMQVAGDEGHKPIVWYFRDLPDDGYFTGYVKEMTTGEEVQDTDEEDDEE
jgi:CRISPR-associated endonuclease/helicase Cas3